MTSHPPPDPRLAGLAGDLARFRAFVQRRVADAQTADDVLQDAFARAAAGIGGLRDGDRLDAWFYRILRNRIADLGAARRPDGGLDADLLLAPADDRRQVCACLLPLIGRLPAAQAEALRLLDVEGLAAPEAASRLGISVEHLHVRRHRARAALRRELLAACGACAGEACIDCTCAPSAES